MQFREFCKIKNVVAILSVDTCKDNWIGSGLKWCSHDEFQDELIEESFEEHIASRRYDEMQFNINKAFENKCKKYIKTLK